METCLICGEGHLHEIVESEITEYGGVTEMLPLYYSECDSCGSIQADSTQISKNQLVMIDFQNRVNNESAI